MPTDSSITVGVLSTVVVLAFFTGVWVGLMGTLSRSMTVSHDYDACECTITCPESIESIQYSGNCYCKPEVK